MNSSAISCSQFWLHSSILHVTFRNKSDPIVVSTFNLGYIKHVFFYFPRLKKHMILNKAIVKLLNL
jgi:hypothetical protein